MSFNRMKWVTALCLGLSMTAGAAAQDFPTRPLTVVSPFPAGGATDTLTRLVVERMSRPLGQPIIVENRAGAGTAIGASSVANSRADGYTFLMATNSTLVTNRYLYQTLSYDPDGFTPIGMVGIGPLVLLSSPKRPFKSTADLVDYAKKHPGELTFATFGAGTSSHLAAEMFMDKAGVKMLHVPYKGATQALPALISGDVDVFFDMVATGMPQVKAGKMNVFGITSEQRLESEADIPTFIEQGYSGFDLPAWFSFVAPKGTPPAAVEKLQAALADALKDDTVRSRMLSMGIQPADGSAEALVTKMNDEKPVVEALIKQANIVIQ